MEGCERCTLSHSIEWTLVSFLYLPADKSYYKNKVNFGYLIPFSTSRCKMEGCESTLSPSLDCNWSHVYGPFN